LGGRKKKGKGDGETCRRKREEKKRGQDTGAPTVSGGTRKYGQPFRQGKEEEGEKEKKNKNNGGEKTG